MLQQQKVYYRSSRTVSVTTCCKLFDLNRVASWTRHLPTLVLILIGVDKHFFFFIYSPSFIQHSLPCLSYHLSYDTSIFSLNKLCRLLSLSIDEHLFSISLFRTRLQVNFTRVSAWSEAVNSTKLLHMSAIWPRVAFSLTHDLLFHTFIDEIHNKRVVSSTLLCGSASRGRTHGSSHVCKRQSRLTCDIVL